MGVRVGYTTFVVLVFSEEVTMRKFLFCRRGRWWPAVNFVR